MMNTQFWQHGKCRRLPLHSWRCGNQVPLQSSSSLAQTSHFRPCLSWWPRPSSSPLARSCSLPLSSRGHRPSDPKVQFHQPTSKPGTNVILSVLPVACGLCHPHILFSIHRWDEWEMQHPPGAICGAILHHLFQPFAERSCSRPQNGETFHRPRF